MLGPEDRGLEVAVRWVSLKKEDLGDIAPRSAPRCKCRVGVEYYIFSFRLPVL